MIKLLIPLICVALIIVCGCTGTEQPVDKVVSTSTPVIVDAPVDQPTPAVVYITVTPTPEITFTNTTPI